MTTTRRQGAERRSDGLDGQWLSLEELGAHELFTGSKRAFKLKLNTNLEAAPGEREPGIKAVVRREYPAGATICEAGAYGSTAFLLLEGRATAFLPDATVPPAVPGRSSGSLAMLGRIFRRRAARPPAGGPTLSDVGEVSRYATLARDRGLAPQALGPGDVFGVDTCVNFYPREATVRAEEPCVVLEMLRSVLDTIREAGSAGGRIEALYRERAIRTTLHLTPLFQDLPAAGLDALAAQATLLTTDADEVREGVIFSEGAPADAVYVMRAGTIKLTRAGSGGEVVLAYLGRGASFGLEPLRPFDPGRRWELRCTSHPDLAPREIRAPLTFGRSAGCELVLPSETRAIGRRHARIEERDGELVLVDLDSANFTLLNGERIREVILALGDRITIVDYTFEVTAAAGAPAAPGEPSVRVASAAVLDEVEIVRLPAAAVLALAAESEGVARAASSAARALDAELRRRPAPESAFVATTVALNLYNSQNTLLIDLDRCTRCDECVRACADAHDGVARFTRDGPRFGRYLVTMACRSCTDPKCMVGCPVGSIRRSDSLEIRIEDWCIGCERCANQCPFGNINMVELAALPEPPHERPGVTMRATVCDLCAGHESPNCVYACPHDAAIRVDPRAFLAPEDQR